MSDVELSASYVTLEDAHYLTSFGSYLALHRITTEGEQDEH